MDDNGNALVRLAERLARRAEYGSRYCVADPRDYGMAARIVAELAKVDDNTPGASCLTATLMRCRAIAEGGGLMDASSEKGAARRPGKPMRNCDRFADGDDAFHAFDVECKLRRISPCRAGKGMCTGHDSIHCFKDWLFAPCEAPAPRGVPPCAAP